MFVFSPLEQFNIISIIPIGIGNFNISFTNSSLLSLIVVSLMILLLEFVSFKSTLVPNRWQSAVEQLYTFVLSLLTENVGEKGVKYFPIFFVTFMFLFFCNLIGMVPYSFTVTSHIVITFGLALSLFIGINIIGIRTHGFHFLSLFLPAGAPLLMAPLLVMIELVSYSFRVISLAVRLFANMMAGHTLLKIIAGFA
jgi:ATP synthase subunit 6